MSYPTIVAKNSEIGVGGRTSVSPTGEGSGRGAQLKVSGTTWSTPGWCSITKSNSAIEKKTPAVLCAC